MRELIARLRDWLRRDRLDAELAEELRFHRELLERDARAVGAATDEAAWAARRKLGNTTRVTEESRDRWSLPWLDHLQQDVRYALRGLRRSPGFAVTVILTLGLGIGANVAMFGVIDRLMFRPDPYLRDPGSAHRVYLQMTGRERQITLVSFPYARYLDLKRWTTSFSQVAAFVQARHAVGTGEATRVRKIAGVSAGFFDFFEARPVLGRFFLATEDTIPAGANVAVLSFAFWSSDFGQRDVIGESIQVGNEPYTIIGVAPEGFTGVSEGTPPSVWLPITTYGWNEGGGSRRDYFERYNWDWTEMVVRRKPGVSAEAASEDLTRAFVRSRQAARVLHPSYVQVERANPRALVGALKTMGGPDPGLESRTLLWVTGVAVIVLLIACANVANLMLVRALRRRREVALRIALGVSRGRLATQSFTESLVLAALGCVAGIAIAQWGGASLRGLFLPYESAMDFATDWRTLGVATAVALAAGLLTGLAPVLLAGHGDLTSALKSGAREGTYQRSRLRAALLVTQGALSVVLLVGAGLFVRSLGKVSDMHLGYDVNPILMAEWESRGTPMTAADRRMVRDRILETARGIPGVEHAAWVTNTPVHGTSTLGLSVPGVDSVAALGRFTYQTAGPDYFATIGTRILRGRAFTRDDRAGAPLVTVVSEAMARKLWPGRDALGQCIRIGWWPAKADTMPCTTVIGVAENAVNSFEEDLPLRYYLPGDQVDFGGSLLLLRMRGDPIAAVDGVRRALQAVMPGLSYVFVQPFSELIERQRRSWRLGATMFVGFGVLALLVAGVGLYGVIAYMVAQRMHELGVRIALGAQGRDVVRLVVGQGLRFAIAGVAVGCLLALAAARWIQPLLFQQSATDPVVFGVVGILLIAVAVVASTVPAVRATRADPNTVLRVE
jgi:putative ABC transport system permease protein